MGNADPITDVRDIAHIAYGFKASKALFSAIELGIFGHLAGTAKSLSTLSALTTVPPNRLEALLTALCGLALLSKTDDFYRNAPACEEYLVPGKRGYFGDYFRLQTERIIFPAFAHLTALLTDGHTSAQWGKYDALMRDQVEADAFSRGIAGFPGGRVIPLMDPKPCCFGRRPRRCAWTRTSQPVSC